MAKVAGSENNRARVTLLRFARDIGSPSLFGVAPRAFKGASAASNFHCCWLNACIVLAKSIVSIELFRQALLNNGTDR
jgi:hypothetical protein